MNEKISNTIALHQMSINELKEIKHRVETTESEDVRFRIETKHWYGYSEPFIAKDESQQMLSWFQIIMLIGRPLWDKTRKKWRILNGYQSVLGNTNNLFYEVTFTDTPYWENYADKQLYLSVPVEKEKQKESGDKGSNNKDK